MAKKSMNALTFENVMRSINEKRRNQGLNVDDATAEVIGGMPLARLMRCLTYVAIEEGHDWHLEPTCPNTDGDTLGEQLGMVLYDYIVDFVLGDEVE